MSLKKRCMQPSRTSLVILILVGTGLLFDLWLERGGCLLDDLNASEKTQSKLCACSGRRSVFSSFYFLYFFL